MTTPDEYVPSEDEMISGLVQIPGEPAGIYRHVRVDEMKRGLARVRRDAARAALDGLAKHATALAEGGRVGSFRNHWWTVAGLAEGYRDTHYPEETP